METLLKYSNLYSTYLNFILQGDIFVAWFSYQTLNDTIYTNWGQHAFLKTVVIRFRDHFSPILISTCSFWPIALKSNYRHSNGLTARTLICPWLYLRSRGSEREALCACALAVMHAECNRCNVHSPPWEEGTHLDMVAVKILGVFYVTLPVQIITFLPLRWHLTSALTFNACCLSTSHLCLLRSGSLKSHFTDVGKLQYDRAQCLLISPTYCIMKIAN